MIGLTKKAHDRIHDTEARKLWESSGLVAVSSLRKGDVFETRDGLMHIWQRQETSGTIHATPYGHDQYNAHMVESCMVRPVMRSQCYTPEE